MEKIGIPIFPPGGEDFGGNIGKRLGSPQISEKAGNIGIQLKRIGNNLEYTAHSYNLNVRHTPNPSQEGNPNRSNLKGVEFPSGEGLGVCQKGK